MFLRLLCESQLDNNKVTPYRMMAYSLIGSSLNYQNVEKYKNYAAFKPNFPTNSATSDDLIDAIAASKAANEKLPP